MWWRGYSGWIDLDRYIDGIVRELEEAYIGSLLN
jgi:hypothetical protein